MPQLLYLSVLFDESPFLNWSLVYGRNVQCVVSDSPLPRLLKPRTDDLVLECRRSNGNFISALVLYSFGAIVNITSESRNVLRLVSSFGALSALMVGGLLRRPVSTLKRPLTSALRLSSMYQSHFYEYAVASILR